MKSYKLIFLICFLYWCQVDSNQTEITAKHMKIEELLKTSTYSKNGLDGELSKLINQGKEGVSIIPVKNTNNKPDNNNKPETKDVLEGISLVNIPPRKSDFFGDDMVEINFLEKSKVNILLMIWSTI